MDYLGNIVKDGLEGGNNDIGKTTKEDFGVFSKGKSILVKLRLRKKLI